jgi:hypothetical protein
MVRGRSQKNNIPGGPVHIGQSTAMPVPDFTDFAQRLGGIEPPGRVVNPHGVEMGYAGKQVRPIRVSPDHPPAVPFHPYDSPVFPVTDLLLVGKLELTHQVPGHWFLFRGLLHVFHEARPRPFFELIQKRRLILL